MGIDYTKRPAQPAPPTAGPPRVSLTKAAPTVSLTKPVQPEGVTRVNLNWSVNVDLDLGCLYELTDGSKGVIQALGDTFGSLHASPFIALDGDDRTGTASSGEKTHINLAASHVFQRVLLFAMIYSGAADWAAVDGVGRCTRRPVHRWRYDWAPRCRVRESARLRRCTTHKVHCTWTERSTTSMDHRPIWTKPTDGGCVGGALSRADAELFDVLTTTSISSSRR